MNGDEGAGKALHNATMKSATFRGLRRRKLRGRLRTVLLYRTQYEEMAQANAPNTSREYTDGGNFHAQPHRYFKQGSRKSQLLYLRRD